MNLRRRLFVLVGIAAAAGAAATAAPASDLATPAKRAQVVETAERLAQTPTLEPLPATLPQPFHPPGFDQPDPSEVKPSASGIAATDPATDRDVLNKIVARIRPSGIINMGGEPLLIFGQKRLKVGDHLIVTLEKTDYDVEITAIDTTTYTLRLNRDEITRSLKPGKSP
jgi:hypothetical protein